MAMMAKKKRIGSSLVCALLGSLGLAACETTDKTEAKTSIDEKKTLSSLTEPETETYCQDLTEWVNGFLTNGYVTKRTCNGRTGTAGTQTQCRELRDNCIKNPSAYNASPRPAIDSGEICPSLRANHTACEGITVEQYNECIGEAWLVRKVASDKNPCDTWGRAPSPPSGTPACAIIQEKCPALQPDVVP